MLLFYSIKLTLSSIFEIFKILFYILFTFVLAFGSLLVLAYDYFDLFIHTGIFDNIYTVLQGLFVDLNVEKMLSGIDGIFLSLNEYFTILGNAMNILEYLAGFLLIILLIVVLLYLSACYRFAINKILAGYVISDKSKTNLTSSISIPFKKYNQMLTSVILCGAYDIIVVLFTYNFLIELTHTDISTSGQYSIFLAIIVVALSFRKMIFLGWDYLQSVKNNNSTTAFLQNIQLISNQPMVMFINCVFITLMSWLFITAMAQIFVLYLSIFAIAAAYLWSKNFGFVAHYYFSGERLYIKNKRVYFYPVKNKSIINKYQK